MKSRILNNASGIINLFNTSGKFVGENIDQSEKGGTSTAGLDFIYSKKKDLMFVLKEIQSENNT